MNLLEQFLESTLKGSAPNKFTTGMGNLIRKAREEAGYSQRDLAAKIFRRQAALSEMENGLMEPDAETLLSLAYHLRKPITYFFPKHFKPEPEVDELTEIEKSLLMEARQLDDDDLKRIIAQVRAITKMYDQVDKEEDHGETGD